jgi:hypothetical protein
MNEQKSACPYFRHSARICIVTEFLFNSRLLNIDVICVLRFLIGSKVTQFYNYLLLLPYFVVIFVAKTTKM